MQGGAALRADFAEVVLVVVYRTGIKRMSCKAQ